MQLKSFITIFFCLIGVFFVPQVSADAPPVINEVIVHPSGSNKEWVEFYTNGTDLTNYWIDDDTDFTSDSGGSTKKQMTSLVTGSDVHHLVYELPSAIFNNAGDTVALFTPDGQLVDQFHYSSDPGSDISIGRSPDATGGFTVLANATRGSANSGSKPPDTPTPAPTTKPTKTPSPTKPPTSSDSASNGVSSSTDLGNTTTNASRSITANEEKIGTDGAHPTSILGVSTKAAERKSKPTPQVMVKGESTNTVPLMITSFGGLFLLACAILLYLKKRRIWK